eukprot:1182637-Prorocentrum_minimum.AAC.2
MGKAAAAMGQAAGGAGDGVGVVDSAGRLLAKAVQQKHTMLPLLRLVDDLLAQKTRCDELIPVPGSTLYFLYCTALPKCERYLLTPQARRHPLLADEPHRQFLVLEITPLRGSGRVPREGHQARGGLIPGHAEAAARVLQLKVLRGEID